MFCLKGHPQNMYVLRTVVRGSSPGEGGGGSAKRLTRHSLPNAVRHCWRGRDPVRPCSLGLKGRPSLDSVRLGRDGGESPLAMPSHPTGKARRGFRTRNIIYTVEHRTFKSRWLRSCGKVNIEKTFRLNLNLLVSYRLFLFTTESRSATVC